MAAALDNIPTKRYIARIVDAEFLPPITIDDAADDDTDSVLCTFLILLAVWSTQQLALAPYMRDARPLRNG